MKKEILEEFLYKYFNLQVNIIDFQFYEFISQGRLDILIEDYKTKSYDFIVNNNLNIFENNFTNNSFNSICDIISFFIVKKLSLKCSELLFQVIADCYERKSLIITTNLEFGKWISIFMDKKITSAIIDRIIHHGHVIYFTGDSYRIKNSTINSI